jgi:hypothetical protein
MVEAWAFNVLDNGQTQIPSQGHHEWFIELRKDMFFIQQDVQFLLG